MTEAPRVGFFVSGGGRLVRAALLHAGQCGIVPAVVVAEDSAAADLDDFCAGMSVRLHRIPRSQPLEPLATDVLREARVDLVSLTFDRIIPASLVAEYAPRMLNVHPGLLPAFPGLRALEQVAASGTRYAGATVHEVEATVDTGQVIAQCVLGTRPGETANALGRRMFGPLRLMYLQVLAWYAAGRVTHDEAGRVVVTGATYGEFPVSPSVEDGFPQ